VSPGSLQSTVESCELQPVAVTEYGESEDLLCQSAMTGYLAAAQSGKTGSETGPKEEGTEPPRDCRRPNSLRGWRHGKTKQVLPRGAGASSADGV